MVSHRAGRLLVVLAVLFAAFPALAQQKLTVTAGGKTIVYALHYLAVGKGFYRQEGLDADTVVVASGTQQAASVMGGSADITVGGFEQAIHSVSQGGSLVAIAMLYKVFPYAIVLSNRAVQSSGITQDMALDEKVKRLKGLSLGVSGASSAGDVFLRVLLTQRGMNPEGYVTIRPVGAGTSMYAAFTQGAVDGFIFNSPFPELAVGSGLGRVVVTNMTGEVPEYRGTPFLGVLTSRATLAAKRPLLQAAVRAITRSIVFVHAHPDEAKQVVRTFFPEVQDDVFDLAFATTLAGLPDTPVVTPDDIARAVATLNLNEKTPIRMQADEVVYPDLARAAAADLLGK